MRNYSEKIFVVVLRDAWFFLLYISHVVDGVVKPRSIVVNVKDLNYHRRRVGKLVIKHSIHQSIFLHIIACLALGL